jgi:hypothetical protein
VVCVWHARGGLACLRRLALSRRHLVTKTRELSFEREVLRLETVCREFVRALHLHSKDSLHAFVGLFSRALYMPRLVAFFTSLDQQVSLYRSISRSLCVARLVGLFTSLD